MRPEQRRERILDAVRTQQKVGVDELAETLAISRETIRRDLNELADKGLVRKVHGGAVMPDARTEGVFAARMGERAAEKRAIAERAAALFHPGDTLFIDTGTTTIAFAEELARREGLTVITNSLAIAQILGRSGNGHAAYLLGGAFSEDASETLGPLAVEQVGNFHAEHAVLTVGAVGVAGLLDYNVEEARLARAMLGQARRVTVLADDSKLGAQALFPVAPLRQVHRLVTNAAPEPDLATALADAAIELIIAGD